MGVPEIGTVTIVLLVLVAVPAVNPAGNPVTKKLEAVIGFVYIPFDRVKITLASDTISLTFNSDNPVEVTSIVGKSIVVIGLLS